VLCRAGVQPKPAGPNCRARGGRLQAVDADLGTKVEEKQTLAKIWSAAIAEAVAKAVLSHQTLERERKLRRNASLPRRTSSRPKQSTGRRASSSAHRVSQKTRLICFGVCPRNKC